MEQAARAHSHITHHGDLQWGFGATLETTALYKVLHLFGPHHNLVKSSCATMLQSGPCTLLEEEAHKHRFTVDMLTIKMETLVHQETLPPLSIQSTPPVHPGNTPRLDIRSGHVS